MNKYTSVFPDTIKRIGTLNIISTALAGYLIDTSGSKIKNFFLSMLCRTGSEWICGFANAQGGKIYIGTKDDGTVVGLKDSKKLLEDISNKIQNKLGIVADVNLLTESGLEYIEIIVNPWAFPVNYDGEYHYRSGSTKQH